MFAASKSGKPAASGAVTDPNFNNTVLLLETTGTNGQQNNTFLDSSTNNFTLTRTGTPTQGTFTPFSQTGWSGYFNGTTDYLSASGSACFSGTQDFTVEMWLYWPAIPTSDMAFIGTLGSGAGSGIGIYNFATSISIVKTASAATVYFGSKTQLTINQWNHLAITRSGNVHRCFINGVLDTAGAVTSTANWGTGTTTYIGSQGTGALFTGYMSNVRVVTGTALYTANFTPPTAPLTAVSGTSLLTLQSNYFKDNSSNNFTLTATGTPSIQAFSPFAPTAAYSTATVGGSGYFNGTTDYLSLASSVALQLPADFTIECWVYTAIPSIDENIFDTLVLGGSGARNDAFVLIINATAGTLKIFSATSFIGTTTSAIKFNAWNHVAVARSGTSMVVYINGVSSLSLINSTNFSSGGLTLGRLSDSAGDWYTGYISNLRIVKGTAVYTANFTPPTAPLTAVTNTSLLLNATNAGVYDATAKNNLTTVGSAQVSTAQSQFGGSSMLFNGTTDYLTTIDKPIAQLGTGNFTIEGWVYLNAVGTARGLVSKGAAATGWSVGISAANVLTFAYTASTLTAATALSVSTWYYFAVVRSGTATGNVKIYLNGSVDATSGGAITDNFNQTSTGYIGADRVGTSLLSGYLDEVRVTRVARTITTPTAAFPTS